MRGVRHFVQRLCLYSALRSIHRRRELLLETAGALGLHLYVLDARFLWEYKHSGKFTRNVGLPHQRSSFHSRVLLTQANTNSVIDIAKQSPCLLYIEGLEDFLGDIKGLRLASGPAEDIFAQSLSSFLADLLSRRGQT